MSRILILDNFYDNAEDLREFALSSRFFSHEEMSHKVGWRGFRTDELSGSSNYLIFRTCQKIKQKVSECKEQGGGRQEMARAANIFVHTQIA